MFMRYHEHLIQRNLVGMATLMQVVINHQSLCNRCYGPSRCFFDGVLEIGRKDPEKKRGKKVFGWSREIIHLSLDETNRTR